MEYVFLGISLMLSVILYYFCLKMREYHVKEKKDVWTNSLKLVNILNNLEKRVYALEKLLKTTKED